MYRERERETNYIIYIYVYIYICMATCAERDFRVERLREVAAPPWGKSAPRGYGRFPKFHRVFLGRDPGTLKSDIVSKKTSIINLFGCETLKLKIRRLKLWKPTLTI